MYEETLELIDKIEATIVNQDGDEMDIKIQANIHASEIGELCEAIAKQDPHTSDGFRFWYEILSVEQIFKIYFFLEKCTRSNEMPQLIELATALTLELVRQALQLPCEIEIERRESDYFSATEEILDFYVPIDDFEAAHEKTHEVMKIVGTSYETGGWVQTLHTN